MFDSRQETIITKTFSCLSEYYCPLLSLDPLLLMIVAVHTRNNLLNRNFQKNLY